jgi:clan AA aspartic protease (TIGR02281 family)
LIEKKSLKKPATLKRLLFKSLISGVNSFRIIFLTFNKRKKLLGIMKKIFFFLLLLFLLPVFIQAQVRIKMTKENGVYTMPCTVNELRLHFIFDTGASNVCISLSEAIFMLKNGYMSESDIKGSSYSQIANGEIIENTTVTLREVVIGGITLRDVEAIIIHQLSTPLLLGQSAIHRKHSLKCV